MSGVAVAYGGPIRSQQPCKPGVRSGVQQIEVSFDKPTVKAAKLTMEGRLIGFLRSHKVGSADVCAPPRVWSGGTGAALQPCNAESRGRGCQSISINDKEAPPGVVRRQCHGKFNVNQSFKVSATMPKMALASCKAPSVEFA